MGSLGDFITAPLDVITNGVALGANMYNADWSRKFNESEAMRNQMNTLWNQQFQQNQFAYMQHENDLMRQREDTAMTRRVEDLKNAGLNPLTILGSGSSMAQLGATSSSAPGSGTPLRSPLNNISVDMSLTRLRNETKVADAQAQNLRDTGQAALQQAGASVSQALTADSRLRLDQLIHSDEMRNWRERFDRLEIKELYVSQGMLKLQQEVEKRISDDEWDKLELLKKASRFDELRLEMDRIRNDILNSFTEAELQLLMKDLKLRNIQEVRAWIDTFLKPLKVIF